MLNTTIGTFRKYGKKVIAAGGALALSTAAMAEPSAHGATIVAKVTDSFSTGEIIAAAVVMGFFSLWAIKLLWRAK